MSIFPQISTDGIIDQTLKNLGLGGSAGFEDAVSSIISKNLQHAINKNINPPQNNSPSPIYSVPASQPAADFFGLSNGGYVKWAIGGAALVGLYFVLRRR